MADFVTDTFTDTDGVILSSHIGELGATWTNRFGGENFVIKSNRIFSAVSSYAIWSASGTSTNGEFNVEATFRIVSDVGLVWIHGRFKTNNGDCYFARLEPGHLKLMRNGGDIVLDDHPITWNVGQDYVIRLEIKDATKKIFLDGVEVCSSIDNVITGAAGELVGVSAVAPGGSTTTGYHIADFRAYPIAVAPLDAGVITLSSETDTTTNLTGTAASGGTAPYTYQWYRSVSSGFTPGAGNTVSGATSQNLNDTGLSGGTQYYYKRVTIDNVSATATSNELSVVTYTSLAINNSSFIWSPYNFNVTSGSAITTSAGAYLRANFSGTSFTFVLDNSNLSGLANTPILRWSIDNGAWQNSTLSFGSNTLSLATGLSNTSHDFEFVVNSTDPTNVDRWNIPLSAVKITKIFVDGGKTINSISRRPKNLFVLGDSIVENFNQGQGGWSWLLGEPLNAEFGIVGNGYQGWCQSTPGNVPPLFTPSDDTNSAWNKYYSGQSRLSGGALLPSPDFIINNHGQNDLSFGSSDSSVISSVTGWLSQIRTAAPNAKIYITIPFGQGKSTAITSGVNLYKNTNTSDINVKIINLGNIGFGTSMTSATAYTNDGIHPSTLGNSRIAPIIINNISNDIAPKGINGSSILGII